MPTQNVNLPGHQADFIRQSVQTGRYQNASEVVRAGLRLLEQREAEDRLRLEVLQCTANDAFDSLDRGEAITLTTDSLEGMFDEIDAAVRPR